MFENVASELSGAVQVGSSSRTARVTNSAGKTARRVVVAQVDVPTPPRILVAESEPELRERLSIALRGSNFRIDFAENGEQVLNALAKSGYSTDLVILDTVMPRKDGITTLKEIRYQNLELPVIMVSSVASQALRAEAMASGANEFLTKPVSYEELRRVVDAHLSLLQQAPTARPLPALPSKPGINLNVGNWARQMEPLLNRLAACDVPVLLQGETGVGKEVLARHIHNQSARAGKIFLKLNCAALPAELVESELFGYEKGAFTGALKNTPGKFELANGGTILLDEIGDMDLRLQAKLLQVLQDREFHRIGAKEATQVDVRVIAATHRILEERILQGEFREDLYYRLNVLNIVIPPLRERPDEIIPLALSFLKKHAFDGTAVPEITPPLATALLRHPWPGNIRELENVMRRYLVIRNSDMIVEELQRLGSRGAGSAPSGVGGDYGALPSRINAPHGSQWFGKPTQHISSEPLQPVLHSSAPSAVGRGERPSPELRNLHQARHTVETELIMKALYSTQWNRKRAASLLGVDYKALLYKMKKLGID